jgi:5-methylcytosine-specific restriction endonuclease McrA
MERSAERLEAIFEKTDGRCHICGTKLAFCRYGQDRGWEIEHSIPVSLGGTDRLSNLYAAHIACNREKGIRTIVPPVGGTNEAERLCREKGRKASEKRTVWVGERQVL